MLVNYMESIVEDVYEDIVKGFPNFCNCEICRADVICMALNKLPPVYNTTSQGQAYAKLMEHNPQFKVQAMQAVGSAIQKVIQNPRHKFL